MTTDSPIRLSQLSHGGGCGCKLAPSVLRELLAGQPVAQAFPDLLVGTETADDAAVYRVSDDLAVIATTDFFMPMVDDPHAFGRIAATNAISTARPPATASGSAWRSGLNRMLPTSAAWKIPSVI